MKVTTPLYDPCRRGKEKLLAEYDLAYEQLEIVEKEISTVLERISFAQSILVIKGISGISLAGILGEADDISGFVHGNACCAMQDLTSQKRAQANGRGK